MKKFLPFIAAVGITVLWGAMLLVVPRILLLLPSLPSEMPIPTLVTWWGFEVLGKTVTPLLALATASLLCFRQFAGWVYALVLCVVWDVAFVGLLLPVMDNLKSGFITDLSFFLLPSLAFLLNQALFVLLIVKRRDFAH